MHYGTTKWLIEAIINTVLDSFDVLPLGTIKDVTIFSYILRCEKCLIICSIV
jgi:hypothetical protein